MLWIVKKLLYHVVTTFFIKNEYMGCSGGWQIKYFILLKVFLSSSGWEKWRPCRVATFQSVSVVLKYIVTFTIFHYGWQKPWEPWPAGYIIFKHKENQMWVVIVYQPQFPRYFTNDQNAIDQKLRQWRVIWEQTDCT